MRTKKKLFLCNWKYFWASSTLLSLPTFFFSLLENSNYSIDCQVRNHQNDCIIRMNWTFKGGCSSFSSVISLLEQLCSPGAGRVPIAWRMLGDAPEGRSAPKYEGWYLPSFPSSLCYLPIKERVWGHVSIPNPASVKLLVPQPLQQAHSMFFKNYCIHLPPT